MLKSEEIMPQARIRPGPFWGRNNLAPHGRRHLVPSLLEPPARSRHLFAAHVLNHGRPSYLRFFKSFSSRVAALQKSLNKPPATRQEPPQQLQTQFNQCSLAPRSILRSLGCYYQKNPNMTAGQYDSSGESQSYLMSPDVNPGLYDGTSSESSASSPMNCNVSAKAAS